MPAAVAVIVAVPEMSLAVTTPFTTVAMLELEVLHAMFSLLAVDGTMLLTVAVSSSGALILNH